MKLTFGGVRGSQPIAQREFLAFGGETTSVLVEGKGGEKLILDAGTGIRKLGSKLNAEGKAGRLLVLLSHFHLDHLTGLPAFPPIYDAKWNIEIAAPASENHTVQRIITDLMKEPLWPVPFEKLSAAIHFTNLERIESEAVKHGELEIRWCPVHHAPDSVAYRIDEPASGTSIVFATDMEWNASTPEEKAAFLHLCHRPAKANVLIMDGHYTPEEYEDKKGWGHSSWKDAASVAEQAGVNHLVITHHAPNHDDEALEAIEKNLKEALPSAALAREGQQIDLA